MEDFERWALESSVHSQHWWKRFTDDTNLVLVKTHAQDFTGHLNSTDEDSTDGDQ